MADTMVTLSIEERIQRQIESGRYADASEVLAQALALMERRENLLLMKALIAEAEESIARGEVYEMTDEFWDEVWDEAMAMDPNTPVPEHLRP